MLFLVAVDLARAGEPDDKVIMTLRRPAAFLTAAALALGGVLLVSTPAVAADQVVTTEADSGAGSLRAAVAAVGSGETITFAPGIDEILLESAIDVPVGVTIQGPTDTTLTIARGDIGAFSLFMVGPSAAGQNFVFADLTLDGRVYPGATPSGSNNPLIFAFGSNVGDLTLSDVNAWHNTAGRGAGLATFNTSGDVLIERGQYSGLTGGEGGAISLESTNGDVTVTGAIFTGNSATGGHGGALEVQVSGADVLIESTEFVNNFTSWAGGEGPGGAIFVEAAASLSVVDSGFTNNRVLVSGDGGAIYASDVVTSIEVSGSTFVGNDINIATSDLGGGLAVVSADATVTITDTLFEANEARTGGGVGLSEVAGATQITGTTFFDNYAADYGGGLYAGLPGSSVDVGGTTFNQNEADTNGGAIYVHGNNAVGIIESEFVANDASAESGALWAEIGSAGSLTVSASQFRDNTAGSLATAIGIGDDDSPGPILIDSSTVMSTAAGSIPLVDLGDVPVAGSMQIRSSTFDTGSGALAPAIRVGTIENVFALTYSTIVSRIGLSIEESDSGDVVVRHTAFETTAAPIEIDVDPAQPELRVGVAWSAFTGTLDAAEADDIVGNQTALPTLGLGVLAQNGGPAFGTGTGLLTRLPETGSPLIDLGQSPAPGSASDFDQRGTGFPRIIGGRIDIGALEAPLPTAGGGGGGVLPPTGATISWWLLIVAGAVFVLGAAALVLARRGRRGGATR